MINPVDTKELRKVIALSDLPEEHLQWIIDHSEVQEWEDGTLVTKTGQPIENMWIMIEGTLSFYMDIKGKLIHFFLIFRMMLKQEVLGDCCLTQE